MDKIFDELSAALTRKPDWRASLAGKVMWFATGVSLGVFAFAVQETIRRGPFLAQYF